MLPTGITICLLAVSIALGATAAGLYWTAIVRHEPSHMEPPTMRVEPIYNGAAAAYRLQNGATIAEAPVFTTRIIADDQGAFRKHLENLAARRHWAPAASRYQNLGYVLPDHDVAILRQLAAAPYEWARQPERQSAEHLPQPKHDTLMNARMQIDAYQPSRDFFIGAVLATVVCAVMSAITAGWYFTEE